MARQTVSELYREMAGENKLFRQRITELEAENARLKRAVWEVVDCLNPDRVSLVPGDIFTLLGADINKLTALVKE